MQFQRGQNIIQSKDSAHGLWTHFGLGLDPSLVISKLYNLGKISNLSEALFPHI